MCALYKCTIIIIIIIIIIINHYYYYLGLLVIGRTSRKISFNQLEVQPRSG